MGYMHRIVPVFLFFRCFGIWVEVSDDRKHEGNGPSKGSFLVSGNGRRNISGKSKLVKYMGVSKK